MSLILSRTMRPADYEELRPELEELNRTIAVVGPVPYEHRRWEYALILRAVHEYFDGRVLEVGDFGCEAGLSPSLMLMAGHNVSLYEIWAWGNKEAEALDKAARASTSGGFKFAPQYRVVNRALGALVGADWGRYDLALCISVIEHISEETAAFNDLLSTVGPGGMLFVTMDFAPSEVDSFYYHWLRARIYNQRRMELLVQAGQQRGFHLLGGEADWSWEHDRVMVQNEYGFSSLVMVRG